MLREVTSVELEDKSTARVGDIYEFTPPPGTPPYVGLITQLFADKPGADFEVRQFGCGRAGGKKKIACPSRIAAPGGMCVAVPRAGGLRADEDPSADPSQRALLLGSF